VPDRPPAPVPPPVVHFWAPTFKWGISLANIADFSRPVEQISTEQQVAVTATGFIWARFSTQIRPVNYNLMTVNLFMGLTGAYQLYRIATHAPALPQSAQAAQTDPPAVR